MTIPHSPAPPPPPPRSPLSIPSLPLTAPPAPTPPALLLPLHPHQQRALHRCQLLERDAEMSTHFHALPKQCGEYISRGGVLADGAGRGKTAVALALITSDDAGDDERLDTLVVVPPRLMDHWQAEIRKFCGDGIECVAGRHAFESAPPPPPRTRRIVLVHSAEVLSSPRLWYDFRRVYRPKPSAASSPPASLRQPSLRAEVHPSRDRMAEYRRAAQFCVSSPRGPCSYTGWVYTDSLHLPKVKWRRVVLDGVGEMLGEGEEEEEEELDCAVKNLVQLTRRAGNVWLISSDPLAGGMRSIRVNNELLGFRRLRMEVEMGRQLPDTHVWERIKRRLYIRSPPEKTGHAVVAAASPPSRKVIRNTAYIQPLPLETYFYNTEFHYTAAALLQQSPDRQRQQVEHFHSHILRKMTVYPLASPRVLQMIHGSSSPRPTDHHNRNEQRIADGTHHSNNNNTTSTTTTTNTAEGALTSLTPQILHQTHRRLSSISSALQYNTSSLFITERSLSLAHTIALHRQTPTTPPTPQISEAQTIHNFFCRCTTPTPLTCPTANTTASLCITTQHEASPKEFIREGDEGSMKEIVSFFAFACGPERVITRIDDGRRIGALDNYMAVMQDAIVRGRTQLRRLSHESSMLRHRIAFLTPLALPAPSFPNPKGGGGGGGTDDYQLATTHGTKSGALIKYLRNATLHGEKAIVFSPYPDLLPHLQNALQQSHLPSVLYTSTSSSPTTHFTPSQRLRALSRFAFPGDVRILLLSISSPSELEGIKGDLGRARHVVVMGPVGDGAVEGMKLEEGLVAAVVGGGGEGGVVVTRLCAVGTLEVGLYREMDGVGGGRGLMGVGGGGDGGVGGKEEEDLTYVCDGWDRPLPKVSVVRKDGDGDGVTVTESVTPDERIRRTFENAKNSGSIIMLSDDESDQEEAGPKETKKRIRDGDEHDCDHPKSPTIGTDRKEVGHQEKKRNIDTNHPDSPNVQQCYVKDEPTADPIPGQTTMPACPITPEVTTMTTTNTLFEDIVGEEARQNKHNTVFL